jgi:hypothetical protein
MTPFSVPAGHTHSSSIPPPDSHSYGSYSIYKQNEPNNRDAGNTAQLPSNPSQEAREQDTIKPKGEEEVNTPPRDRKPKRNVTFAKLPNLTTDSIEDTTHSPRSSRNYGNPLIRESPSYNAYPSTESLSNNMSELIPRLETTSKSRSSLTRYRHQMALGRRTYRDHRYSISKKLEDIEDLASRLDSISTSMHAIQPEIQQQLQHAVRAFKNARISLSASEKEIGMKENLLEAAELKVSSHERNLTKKEQALLRRLPGPSQPPQPTPKSRILLQQLTSGSENTSSSASDNGEDSNDDDEEGDASGSGDGDHISLSAFSGSSASTHPFEQEYYDHIGNVTLAREHLYNLETEHLLNLYAREAQRKEGDKPSTSEPEFYREYFAERKRLIQRYVSSKNEVSRLYKLCKEAKVNVQEPNLPPIRGNTLDHSLRAGHIDIFERGTLGAGSLVAPADIDNLPKVEDPQTLLERMVNLWNSEVLKQTSSDIAHQNHVGKAPWFDDLDWEALYQHKSLEDDGVDQIESTGAKTSGEVVPPSKAASFVGERILRRYSEPSLDMKERIHGYQRPASLSG